MTSKSKSTGTQETPSRRPQQRGLKRARTLLDTAAELFTSKGIEETTVDDIAAAAGIAKGTFYHHYETKAALLAALRTTVMEDFDAHVDEALSKCPADDLLLQLDTWSKAECEAYILMIPRHDIAFYGMGLRWTSRGERHLEQLAALLKRGKDAGKWSIKDPHSTAIFIQRGLLGVIDDMVLSDKDPKGVHREVAELVRRVVLGA